MMTSSNGNSFRVTGPLCGEFTGPGEFPTQRPVTRSVDVFFDLRLNKWLSKQPSGSGDLRRHRGHYDVIVVIMTSMFPSQPVVTEKTPSLDGINRNIDHNTKTYVYIMMTS